MTIHAYGIASKNYSVSDRWMVNVLSVGLCFSFCTQIKVLTIFFLFFIRLLNVAKVWEISVQWCLEFKNGEVSLLWLSCCGTSELHKVRCLVFSADGLLVFRFYVKSYALLIYLKLCCCIFCLLKKAPLKVIFTRYGKLRLDEPTTSNTWIHEITFTPGKNSLWKGTRWHDDMRWDFLWSSNHFSILS